MKENQTRINEYKGRLPKMKERIVAVALLLVMSASMLITVSFAWVALSTNPEVSGVNTSFAANGNLEIALATGTWGSYFAPGASKVGDSNLDVLDGNLTWGNLINLSDPRYGLEKLVLRPALLNENDLSTKPLYGPVYDSSGRVVDTNRNFGYSAWNGVMSRFEPTENLGVRAITSMTYGESGDATIYSAKLDAIVTTNDNVITSYQSIAYNSSYMDSLSVMMAGYMVKNVFKKNENLQSMIKYTTITGTDLDNFIAMYESLIESFEAEADVFAQLLNLQAELDAKKNSKDTWTTITGAQLLAMEYNVSSKTAYKELTKSYTAAKGGFVEEIDQFISDYDLLITDIEKVKQIRSQVSGSVEWNESSVPTASDGSTLDTLISHLVDVNKCTITGGSYTDLKVSSIGGNAALDLIKSGDVCQTKITNGVLYRFDNRSGARLKNKEGSPLTLVVGLQGAATLLYGSQGKISSNVATSANTSYFYTEQTAIKKVIDEEFGAPERIAEDCYGFAIDFWVRTNAGGSFLTLQGNVLTETKEVRVTGRDLNGNTVEIYTITVEVESEETDPDNPLSGVGSSTTYDVYKSTTTNEDEEIVECWRFLVSHSMVSEEQLNGQTPREKYEEVEYVVGYEGDNRVWEGDQHSILTVNSTTQGSGSCYVFYSASPVDQARSLELLKHMRVAFVDANGNLLAQAYMDTELCYETSGKVIVPLVLDENSTVIGTDENGDPIRAITALEQNVATLVTAVVYLEGKDLTNDDVLASADIEGQMNIQFGSSAPLHPIDNETLYNSELYASAEIENTEFNYDDGGDMSSHVKVTVTGTQPKSVKAFFIRQINATQGSKEEMFILEDTDGDGVWEGDYTFKYPGTYVLRSVQIDGADYELTRQGEDGEFPSVVVEGFTIERVSYTLDSYVMTDKSSYSGDVTLKFATDDIDKMPKTVVGTFLREDGSAVNVNFAYDATLGLWKGKANFISSGTYTMQYVKLDGQFRELAGGDPDTQSSLGQWGQWFTIDVTLGMRVRVITFVEPLIMTLENAPDSLPVQVEILDNTGKPVVGLGGASLTYAMSAANTMSTNLVWNSVEECYEGELRVESGTWKFAHVDVVLGDTTNRLTSVNSNSPVFTIIPPEPPKYVDNAGSEYQFVSSGNATVSVTLKDSMAATVYAKLVKVDDAGNPVAGVAPKYVEQYGMTPIIIGNEEAYLYGFVIPSGLWRLEAVSVFNVFDADLNLHTIPEGGVVDEESFAMGVVLDQDTTQDKEIAEKEFVQRTVAALYDSDITVSVEYDKSTFTSSDEAGKVGRFGKDANGNVSSAFMAEHTLTSGGITIKIVDTENLISRGYFSLSDVNLEYIYGEVDAKYGGYTSSVVKKDDKFQTLTFGAKSATEFTLNTAVKFQHAAKYDPTQIAYAITPKNGSKANKSITCSDKKHGEWSIEVWSASPTVIISDITLDGSGAYAIDKFETGFITDSYTIKWGIPMKYDFTINNKHIFAANNTEYISKIEADNRTAWLYFKCSHTSTDSTWQDKNLPTYKPHDYLYNNGEGVPAATLLLSGIGAADNARLTFTKQGGGDVIMITQYTKDSSGSTYWGDYTTYGTSSYEWSKDGTCKRFIGIMDNNGGDNNSDTKTVAGTITANTLVLTYNGAEYTFTIPTITINNPY